MRLGDEVMEKEKIYLDNCAYNRPYDDQTQLKIHLETQAKLKIQDNAVSGKCDLIWSYILEFENNDNPYEYKRNRIEEWKDIAKISVVENEEIKSMAKEIKAKGIDTKDAIHIACAKYAGADYFITTDVSVLKKEVEGINISSPLDYIKDKEE